MLPSSTTQYLGKQRSEELLFLPLLLPNFCYSFFSVQTAEKVFFSSFQWREMDNCHLLRSAVQLQLSPTRQSQQTTKLRNFHLRVQYRLGGGLLELRDGTQSSNRKCEKCEAIWNAYIRRNTSFFEENHGF